MNGSNKSGTGLRVAVVGAGIGGLVTALVLLADGHDVVCFERATELREVGAGIQLSPNGTRVLHRLGLSDALARFAVKSPMGEFLRWKDATVIAKKELNPFSEKRWGAPFYAVHRAELHDMLRSAVPESRVRLGARVAAAHDGPDGATLEFADGSRYAADLVIAADGLHSTVRRQLIGDEKRFGDRHTFRGLVPVERLAGLRATENRQVWIGPGRSMATYPISAGRLVNFAGVFPATAERDESWTAEGTVQEVLDAYEGWHELALKVIAAADKVLILPLYDRLPVKRWSHGRITLLGDAAHPMYPFLAQGATQAIEDAATLGGCLRGTSSEGVIEALKRYETARVERTARVQEFSAGMEIMHFPDGPAQEGRDAMLASMQRSGDPYSPDEHVEDWVYAYDPETGGRWKREPPAA